MCGFWADGSVVFEEPLADEVFAAGLTLEGLADGGALQLGDNDVLGVGDHRRLRLADAAGKLERKFNGI